MLTQGEILRDRYTVIRQLGQGGMGAVYEAHDKVFDTSVALKQVTINLTSTYDTKAQEMATLAFEREAKILAKVNHENVPHVKDYFTEGDGQFLVMELVDGDDLGKLLQQRKAPFQVGTIIEWTDRILDALDYLHSLTPPVIHRDIKPQNLKITTRQKVKLLDFGIAKGSDVQTADTVANQTFIAATLNYSPIEQMLRVLDPTFLAVITHKYTDRIDAILEQNADVRSDLYALGATMYHLATNLPPAEAVKRAIEVWDGKPDPIIEPSKINPEIPNEFSEFLLKSMQIRRESRFSSAREMRSALHQIVEATSNPSLKQTVQLKADDFQSMATEQGIGVSITSDATVSFEALGSQKTEAYDDAISQETISFSDQPPMRIASAAQNTGGSGHPITSELSRPGTAFNQPFNTGQKFDSASQISQKRSKIIWLIPVVLLLLLVVGGGALGAWYFLNKTDQGVNIPANSNTSNSADANSNEKKPDLTVGGQGIGASSNSEVEDSNTQVSVTPGKPESAPAPDSSAPKPVDVAKPRTPKPTPIKKPTPKPKNMDCIFTDDCE